METKVCFTCKQEFPIDCFYKNKKSRERNCKWCKRKLANQRYTITCETCGKDHKTDRKTTRFCSKTCIQFKNKNQTTKLCDVCGTKITRPSSQFNGKRNVYCSYDCQAKGWTMFYSGENAPVYNHEKPLEERMNERKYVAYYEWRKKVYERDEYTCQCCNDDKGGNLVAHHILNYSEHEKLRTVVSNGITLCTNCHKDFHDTYGYTNNNHKQLNKYIEHKRTAIMSQAQQKCCEGATTR